MNEAERIREAMDRNIKRCGSASDTPHYTVQADISYWYYRRHCRLARDLWRARGVEGVWRYRYIPAWPYRIERSYGR